MSTYVPSEAEVEAAMEAIEALDVVDCRILPAIARATLIAAHDLAPDLTRDGQANDCTHMSATGVDTAPIGPSKVWRCDHCGLRWTDVAPTPHEDVAEAWERTIARHEERLATTNGMWARQRLAGKIEGLKLGRSLTLATTPSIEDRNRA